MTSVSMGARSRCSPSGGPIILPAFEQQLTAYEAATRSTIDQRSYWHSSQFQLPQLEIAARKYLLAPPTSTPSKHTRDMLVHFGLDTYVMHSAL